MIDDKYNPIVKKVPYESIHVSERFRREGGNIKELAVDIRLNGLIQPIAVKDIGKDKYELIAGGRRMAACADISHIREYGMPIRMYPRDLSELDFRAVELAENIRRKDLTPIEAIALKAEIHKLQCERHGAKDSEHTKGWTISKTADLIGESVASVSKDLDLADFIDLVPELAECQTKDEVRKVVDGLKKQYKRGKIVTAIEEKKAVTPIDKIRNDLAASYNVGDFLQAANMVESESVDLIEFDPPFAIDLTRVKKLESPSASYQSVYTYADIPPAEYPSMLEAFMTECFRIAKPNSWLVHWFGPDPWFNLVHELATKVGFKGRRLPALWYKRIGQTMNPGLHLGSSYEMFFYFRKGNAKLNKARNNVYDYRPVPSGLKEHATEKPIGLYVDIISTFVQQGSNILSPCLGSGNVILAASNHLCTAFGYDLEQAHKDSFTVKVYEQEPGGYSSYAAEGDIPLLARTKEK